MRTSNSEASVPAPRWMLLGVALIALVPRLYIAATTTYVYDEEHDWIPFANTISLDPTAWNTPIRANHHPGLAGYGIAFGRLVLGRNELGTRAVSIVLGVSTVVLIFVLARGAGGTLPAAWISALLLAANEYHVHASTLATEKAYYLFFATLALWFFLRFLREERPVWLYPAAVAVGLSFLAKESAALLLPVFLITLLVTRQRRWLARWEPYAAILTFAVVIAPDVWWNVTNGGAAASADYGRHLSGISSLGITYQPLVLYGREPVAWALATMGRPFYDTATAYAAGNFVLSLLIAAGVISALRHRSRRSEPRVVLFLTLFCFIFLFFTFIGPRRAPGLPTGGFFWGDLSLLGGVVLGGLWVASLQRWSRLGAAVVLGIGLLISSQRVFRGRLNQQDVEARARPDLLIHAPGEFRDISVTFNYCLVCDQQPRVQLVSARARMGATDIAAEESSRMIADAAVGTDDRSLRVEASAVEPPRQKQYVLVYRVQSRDRPPQTVVARVQVMKRPPVRWPPLAW